jgi:hypothetical protein
MYVHTHTHICTCFRALNSNHQLNRKLSISKLQLSWFPCTFQQVPKTKLKRNGGEAFPLFQLSEMYTAELRFGISCLSVRKWRPIWWTNLTSAGDRIMHAACVYRSLGFRYRRHRPTNKWDSCKVISDLNDRLYHNYLQYGVHGSKIRLANAGILHEKTAHAEGISGSGTWSRTDGGRGLCYGSGIYSYHCWGMWRIHSDNKKEALFLYTRNNRNHISQRY